MKIISTFMAVAAMLMVATASLAQGYPSRPIRFVVPFPAGGGTDIIARELAVELNMTAGWSLVPENRPGKGGNLGVNSVAKSPPDGYTVVLGQTSNLAINPTLYKKLPYDPLKDLIPVALVADAPLVMVVPDNSPYRTLADLIDDARAHPGKLNFAALGNATASDWNVELFSQAADITLRHVPYRGANQALTGLFGGRVQFFMSSISTALDRIRVGKLRALAVTSAKRIAKLPDVPTIGESGYPGFDGDSWYGILVPAKTPPDIVATLNQAANDAIATPEFRQKIEIEGGAVMGGTPEQFAELLKRDYGRWAEVVKRSGAKAE